MHFEPLIRNSHWHDVSDRDWDNWIWQQQNRVKSIQQLSMLTTVSEEEFNAAHAMEDKFRMAITPYYASLIDPSNPQCPIRLQSVPQAGELIKTAFEMEDPLAEESHMPVPGITHRYPDRVLFYTTHNCPVYCRHCTRKRKVSDPRSSPKYDQLSLGINYIASHSEIRDVLISGGDPLSFSDDRLAEILTRLRKIKHVQILRLCTRNLVTLPSRVTDELVEILKQAAPLYVHTQFNHPKELTLEAFTACQKLVDAGCVLNNQMVLLKNVNDQPEIVKELNQRLLFARVQPYYIFLSDMAEGLNHFRVPISRALQIIEKLRGWTSGMAVPHLAIDLPGGGGKITIVPEYLVRKKESKWTFRNYQGQEFDYFDVE